MWHRSCVERFHGEFVERHLYLSTTSRPQMSRTFNLSRIFRTRLSGISFPFLESFRQILGGATSSAVGGGFSRSTILSFLPSSFLPTTRRRSNSRGNGQLSYFLFFFFYLLLAKGNVGKGLRSQHLLYSFRIFRFAGAPLYWETFIPFHLQISRANFPRSLRYLSKVDKYIILWIIILIRNRFRKSS